MWGDAVVCGVGALLPVLFGGAAFAMARSNRPSSKFAQWGRLIVGNVLVFALLISLLWVGGETYFRIWYDSTDSFSHTRVSERWFDRHFQRNNAGFRDNVDYRFPLVSGLRRVSFIGDSFTAGHGISNVENRFGNRVRAANRGKWDVHVLAEVGRDTGAELKLVQDLRRQGYQFDLVVLVYCLNDINDIASPQQSREGRSTDEDLKPGFLVEHSFAVNTFYYRWRARITPNIVSYYDFVHQAYDGPLWEQQKERLKEFRDTCRATGAQLRVVTFPFMHSLGPKYDYRSVHEQLNDCWRELEVPHLDLLSMFEEHVGEELTVNRYDAHPNERAHALAAAAIEKFIEREL